MQDITNSIKVLVRQHKQEQGERLGSSALNRLKSSAGKVIENNRFSQFVPMGLRGHKLAGRLGEVGGMSLMAGGAGARALDAAGRKAANGAPAELQLFKDLGDPHAAAKAATAVAQGVLGAEALGRAEGILQQAQDAKAGLLEAEKNAGAALQSFGEDAKNSALDPLRPE